MREAAAACEGKGGKAIAARADVTDPAAMQALTRRAIEASGIIDV